MSETIPGGVYLVDGVMVDANGKPVEAQTTAEPTAETEPTAEPVIKKKK